ncbi:MAG: hypothetical protein IKT40_07455 [Bacilli bacterium]|nr:hypothetical protein [Bacilli bacterium]
MYVVKRDGTTELFQYDKIKNAINQAFKSCGCEISEEVWEQVNGLYDENQDVTLHVEEIQDAVEDVLMQNCPEIAKCYIIYRYNHKIIRETNDKLTKDVRKKLLAMDVENQNANVDEYSFGGRMGEATRVVTKDFALKHCMSRKSRNNHLNNEIYIHKEIVAYVGDNIMKTA